MSAAIAVNTFAPSNLPRGESATPLNVLIVDEDRFVREACREAATALGYRAMACESAQQAFALIHSQTILKPLTLSFLA